MKDFFYLICAGAILELFFGVQISAVLKDGVSAISTGQPFEVQVQRYFGEPAASGGLGAGSGGSSDSTSGASSILKPAQELLNSVGSEAEGDRPEATEDQETQGSQTETTED